MNPASGIVVSGGSWLRPLEGSKPDYLDCPCPPLDPRYLLSPCWSCQPSCRLSIRSFVYSLVYLFMQQIFIEHLLCARHCSRHWRCSKEQIVRNPCPSGGCKLMRGDKQEHTQRCTHSPFTWFLPLPWAQTVLRHPDRVSRVPETSLGGGSPHSHRTFSLTFHYPPMFIPPY